VIARVAMPAGKSLAVPVQEADKSLVANAVGEVNIEKLAKFPILKYAPFAMAAAIPPEHHRADAIVAMAVEK